MNVVFMVDIQGYKSNTGYEYSVKSWSNWCKKNGHEFVRLTETIHGHEIMNPNWHKFYAFDLIENEGIEVDKLAVVDADTIIHPNSPDLFEFCDNNVCGVHEYGSYEWTLRSIENYSNIFNGEKFLWEDYINSGIIVIDSKWKSVFDYMKDFYFKNREELLELQKFGVGTDQTPFNYVIHRLGAPLKLLPYKYNMSNMPKFKILDDDMLFMKLGYIYHYNGIPNKETSVPHWMKKTYEEIYGK